MATGYTTTDSLADSVPTLLASARIVRENEGVMPQLVDKKTLAEGTVWREVSLEQPSAQAITESTVLDNPQQLQDTLITVTPTMVGIYTFITDRTARRISDTAYARTGSLAQNAIQRKKDEDGLTVLDGFSNSYPGSGSTTLTAGHISAAKALISGNATEPANPPFRGVLHGYQLRDIEDQIIAGVGTYPVMEGLTARVFAEGFRGMIAGVQLYEDGNISISSSEAKGGVFAQEAIILVQAMTPRMAVVRKEDIGGGGTAVYHYDEYAYGERLDTWGVEIYSDATAPTS